MKTISLWEPWATAIALGLKTIETRHWPSNYRGPLAIHAAKTQKDLKTGFDIAETWERMASEDRRVFAEAGYERWRDLPLGHVVAFVRMTNCVESEEILRRASFYFSSSPFGVERRWGNYEDGRFGWMLDSLERLTPPIPARGGQGFWNWIPPQDGVARISRYHPEFSPSDCPSLGWAALTGRT